MWTKISIAIGSLLLVGMLACSDASTSGKSGRDAMSASGRAIGILELDEALQESDTTVSDTSEAIPK